MSPVAWARLWLGLVILVSAEVFSGASVAVGLWNPWTWLMTYPLYFAHFFLFTTLALRTGRTSLPALWLWGVLFGLYESWITKVVWCGYSCDGYAAGAVGPYGYSEISMVFFFHPLASFILPLAVACLLCPPLRLRFPGLACFTAAGRWPLAFQAWLVFSLPGILGFNSGGPLSLMLNWPIALALLWLLYRRARPALEGDGRAIVEFGPWGLRLAGLYLLLLYSVGYQLLRPEGLPALEVQLLTFAWYALAITGLALLRPREPAREATVAPRELERLRLLFGLMVAGSFGFSLLFMLLPGAAILLMITFLAWPVAGALLTAAAVAQGVRERLAANS